MLSRRNQCAILYADTTHFSESLTTTTLKLLSFSYTKPGFLTL